MITTVHAHKGGQGTTTVTAALAVLTTDAAHRTLVVDTGHDLAAVFGLPQHDDRRPGLVDHLQRGVPLPELVTHVNEHLDLLTTGTHPYPYDDDEYHRLTDALSALGRPYDHVVIDTGGAHPWHRHGDRRILVIRPDYLAVRRALQAHPPTHVVIIDEPGRALTTADITAVVGAPITAIVRHQPDIARTIDAGLLTTRIPRSLARALRPLTPAVSTSAHAAGADS